MTHLIDISSVVERDTVAIDGTVYELRKIEELGAFDYQRIVSLASKAEKFNSLQRRPTASEEAQVNKALGEILKVIVLGLDARFLGKIEMLQRAKIVWAWVDENLAAVPTGGAAEGEAPAAPTTGGSSPGSKRSTAATPRRGSTSRASR